MYRLPNSEISMFLASYSSILCAMKKDGPKGLIIGLDHNMDFLKAQQHHLTNEFIQLNLDFGMVPTITLPTRITNSTATLIDNIIVSQSFCGGYIGSIIINYINDHLPTTCVLKSLRAESCEPLEITSRDTRLKNLTALKRALNNKNWAEELSSESPSINMDHVHNTLTSIIDSCIPIRTRKIDAKKLRREPWLTASIKLGIDENKKLYAKMLRKDINVSSYKEYNKTLRKVIRVAKRNYFHEKCEAYKTHTKKLWGLINEISGKTRDRSSLIEYLKIENVNEYSAKKSAIALLNTLHRLERNLPVGYLTQTNLSGNT